MSVTQYLETIDTKLLTGSQLYLFYSLYSLLLVSECDESITSEQKNTIGYFVNQKV